MTSRNSHSIASSLKAAFEHDKGVAIREKRLSVERLADIMANTPATLYKRMEDCTMPANQLAGWFHVTGGKSVIRFLAIQAGGLFIPLPTGRLSGPADIQALQGVLHGSVGVLLAYMQGTATKDEAIAALSAGLEALAFEREQVKKSDQPELEF